MTCLAADPAGTTWAWTAAGLAAVPVLVALNGFFVAAEFALVAVRRTRVDEMVNQGRAGAAAARDAVAHLDRTIAATQLGITLASIALGWVGEPALAALVEPAFAAAVPAAWVGAAATSARGETAMRTASARKTPSKRATAPASGKPAVAAGTRAIRPSYGRRARSGYPARVTGRREPAGEGARTMDRITG